MWSQFDRESPSFWEALKGMGTAYLAWFAVAGALVSLGILLGFR